MTIDLDYNIKLQLNRTELKIHSIMYKNKNKKEKENYVEAMMSRILIQNSDTG